MGGCCSSEKEEAKEPLHQRGYAPDPTRRLSTGESMGSARDPPRQESAHGRQSSGREGGGKAQIDWPNFQSILERLETQTWDDGRLRTVAEAAKQVAFSTMQVKALLESVSFDPHRTQIAMLLYDDVIDIHLFYEVLDAFSFDTERADFVRRLHARPHPRRAPLRPELLDDVVTHLKKLPFDSARQCVIQILAITNQVTCAQGATLLETVAMLPPRKELAVDLHPLLIDSDSNFQSVLKVFSELLDRKMIQEKVKAAQASAASSAPATSTPTADSDQPS